MTKNKTHSKGVNYLIRFYVVIAVLALGFIILIWRLLDLGIFERNFLLKQSDERTVRVINIPAYRGMITDRNDKPLAISTPMDSVWINPQDFNANYSQLLKLSHLVNIPINDIRKRVSQNNNKQFMYLKRELSSEIADKIRALNISGLYFQREYHRYYPEGDVVTHVIGFTNIDGVGQEGLELGFDSWLHGIPGKERVLKDRLGHIIAVMDVMSQPIQGKDLELSIDDRIQYLAYQNLKEAVAKDHARSGSIIVIKPKTGEILAMANVPSYNPNVRPLIPDDRFRNRAVTDLFEPGSTIKTFSVFTALQSGKYFPNSIVNTHPGVLTINGYPIHDDVPDNGILTLTQVLQKSSNIGIAKVILTLPPQQLVDVLSAVGFGKTTTSGFPGESAGVLAIRKKFREIDQAHLAFGYGISITPLQLAHAYSIVANHGVDVPITFFKQKSAPQGTQVLDQKDTAQLLKLLQTVVQPGGSATLAAIPGYQVAGKTGTAYVAVPGGYDKKRYNSSFVGITPVSDPQIVTVVVLNNVQGSQHFGGQVAAPLFATVTTAVLRILDIAPDNLNTTKIVGNNTDISKIHD